MIRRLLAWLHRQERFAEPTPEHPLLQGLARPVAVVAGRGALVDLGRVARHADRDAGEDAVGGRHAERLGQRVVVETGELVRVQPHRSRLQGEVGRSLADVVEGVVAVRRRAGLLALAHVRGGT